MSLFHLSLSIQGVVSLPDTPTAFASPAILPPTAVIGRDFRPDAGGTRNCCRSVRGSAKMPPPLIALAPAHDWIIAPARGRERAHEAWSATGAN